MDGLQLCKNVRDLTTRYTYFVLLTSNDEAHQQLEGMLAGADDYLTKPLNIHQLQLCLVAAKRVVALHVRIHQQQLELKSLNQALYVEGRRDALTGIPNRLQLNEDLLAAQGRVERGEGTYTVALLDIDYFKLYNDSQGHLAGDQTLRAVAQTLAAQKRVNDKVYRYGGEEFCALFFDQDIAGAHIAIERMRAAIQKLEIPHHASSVLPVVTVSAGVAEHPKTRGFGSESLLFRADEALYRAKRTGRNRVEVWDGSHAEKLRASA